MLTITAAALDHLLAGRLAAVPQAMDVDSEDLEPFIAGTSSAGRWKQTPALFTRMSTGPSSAVDDLEHGVDARGVGDVGR